MALRPAARAVGLHRPDDKAAWLRHLDYYVHLHQLADRNLGTVLAALENVGAWDDTIVLFTSDHGDMCGSHGLRSKGPFVYDEIMRVPLYAKVPGVTSPGTATSALGSHVDLAATICALAGADPTRVGATVQGTDLSPVLGDPAARVRDHILFAQDSAQTNELNKVRYALRGFYDGRTKYAPTTGSAEGSHRPGSGESHRGRSSSTRTARSTTTTTSGTTTTATPSSWSTWRTTARAGRSFARSTNGCAGTKPHRSSTSLWPSPSERGPLAARHPTGME